MSPEPVVVGGMGTSVAHLADPGDGQTPTSTENTAPGTIPYGSNVPAGVDIDRIRKDVLATGVSGPADQVAQLKEVVAHAKAQGHDVKIVVLTDRQPKFTYYRDVAIDLQSSTGGTVIVFGPNSVGAQGPDFSRVDLEEAAANNLTLTNPPQAARQMVDDLLTPSLNWTAITLVLMFVVFVGAVVARVLGRRRSTSTESPSPTPESDGDYDASAASGGAVKPGSQSSLDAS